MISTIGRIPAALDALITPRLREANFVLNPMADGIAVDLDHYLHADLVAGFEIAGHRDVIILNAVADQGAVGIARQPGGTQAAVDHEHQQRQREHRADETEFLGQDREDEVVVPHLKAAELGLRPGAIARFAKVMAALEDFARSGCPVLGICNGFQVLTEAHLLPGAVLLAMREPTEPK